MGSLFLNRLSSNEIETLKKKLLEIQHGKCFICEEPIDLFIHNQTGDGSLFYSRK